MTPRDDLRALAEELREAASQCVFENQVERYPGAVSHLLARAADALAPHDTEESSADALGLGIDMLDVDRLRKWAENISEHGANLTHWADPKFIVSWLTAFAGRLDVTVREIGRLRALAAAQQTPQEGWQPIATAPKDGTVIIGALIRDGRVWRVHDMKHNGLAFYTINGDSVPQMTHWIPLPAHETPAPRPAEERQP